MLHIIYCTVLRNKKFLLVGSASAQSAMAYHTPFGSVPNCNMLLYIKFHM